MNTPSQPSHRLDYDIDPNFPHRNTQLDKERVALAPFQDNLIQRKNLGKLHINLAYKPYNMTYAWVS